jgi:Uma2 family endonuclease
MQATIAPVVQPVAVSIRYPVRSMPEAWILPEGTVPEAPIHDQVAEYLKLLLVAWVARLGVPARVARNLAVRWLPDHPRAGIDPDVCLLAPAPADFDRIGSLCTWKAGHVPPQLSIEVVSENHPHKDYSVLQDRYAAMGTRELVVFDPLLAGPRSLGGPVSLQLWRRDLTGVFERVHFSAEPVYSQVLDAWFIPRGAELFIADDRSGTRRWPTLQESAEAEAERARADANLARADAERAQADAERERQARMELEGRLRALEKPS